MRSNACVLATPRPISSVTRVKLALGEILARPSSMQLRARLLVVEAREHVALGDGFALAVAQIDDALADQARHLGPAHRLHRAGAVDDLDRRAAARLTAATSGPRPKRHQSSATISRTSRVVRPGLSFSHCSTDM